MIQRSGVSRWLMARITVIVDDDWDGELGELYPRVVGPAWGPVNHILAIHSLNPRSMAAHQGLYESAMAGTADGFGPRPEHWIPD